MPRLRIGNQYVPLGGDQKETDFLQALWHGVVRNLDPFLEMGQGVSNIIGKVVPDKVDPTDEVTAFLESIKGKMHELGPDEDPDTVIEKIASAIGRTPGEIASILLPGGVLGKGGSIAARALGTPGKAAALLGSVSGLRAASDPEADLTNILGAAGVGAATGAAFSGIGNLVGGMGLPARMATGGGLGAATGAAGAAIAGGSGQDIADEALVGAVLGGITPPGERVTLKGKEYTPAELAAALKDVPEVQPASQRDAIGIEARAALTEQRRTLETDIEALRSSIKNSAEQERAIIERSQPQLLDKTKRRAAELKPIVESRAEEAKRLELEVAGLDKTSSNLASSIKADKAELAMVVRNVEKNRRAGNVGLAEQLDRAAGTLRVNIDKSQTALQAASARRKIAGESLDKTRLDLSSMSKELKEVSDSATRLESASEIGMARALMQGRRGMEIELAELQSKLGAVGVEPARDITGDITDRAIDFEARSKQQTAESPIKDTMWRKLARRYISHQSIQEEAVRSVEAQHGVTMEGESNPVRMVEQMAMNRAPQSRHVRRQSTVIDEGVKASGDPDTKGFSKFYFWQRIASGDRQALRNPENITQPEAQMALDKLRRESPEKFAAYDDLLNKFHKNRIDDVLTPLLESRRVSKEQYDALVANRTYNTWQVVDLLDDVAPGVRKEMGTSRAIADPLMETMLNDMHLIAGAQRTRAARATVNMLATFYPDWIKKPAESSYKAPKGWGEIAFVNEGKQVKYIVPEQFAEIYKVAPSELADGMKTYSTLASLIRKPFIDWNIAWALRNPVRDFRAFGKNVVEDSNPVSAALTTARMMMKSGKEVLGFVKRGEVSPDIDAMLKNRMMIEGGERQLRAVDSADTTWDILQRGLGKKDAEHQNAIKSLFGKLTGSIEKIGEFGERLTKVAGYKYGKEQGWDQAKIADAVINMSGSPNFYRRGTMFPVYNSILLFSNASKEGYAQSLRGLRKDPTGYIAKTIVYDLAPKVLLFGAAKGLLDDPADLLAPDMASLSGGWLSKSLSGVSDHDKRNYTIVPLPFFTESGKSIYLRLAHDHTGQAIGSMLWDSLEGLNNENPNAVKDLLKTVLESFPYGPAAVHPFLEQAIKMGQYAAGINPTDLYRGRQIMPERTFQAGGERAFGEFAKDAWNSLGGSSIKVFNTEDPESIQSMVEKALGIPLGGAALGSILKVSNYGQKETLRELAQQGRIERSQQSLTRDEAIEQSLRAGSKSDADMFTVYTDLTQRGYAESFNAFKRRWTELRMRIYGNPLEQVLSSRGIPSADRDRLRDVASRWGL